MKVGDEVAYRAMAGDVYDAIIVDVCAATGRVGIDVAIPGVKDRLHLKAIRWYDRPDDPRPGARPKPIPS